MECEKIRKKLTAYLEGVVSPEERRFIEKHLPSCHGCSNTLEDLKRTEGLIKGLEEVEPPPWLKERVVAQVRVEEEAKKSLFRRLFYPLHVKVPIEAFATVLIVVVAIYVFRAGEPEIKGSLAPSTTQQVVGKGEASKETPSKESTPGGSLFQEASPRMASPKEAQKERADLPALGRELLEKETLGPGRGEGAGAQKVREEAPAAPFGLRAPAQKRTEAISITIHAKDVETTIREVENLLARLGANRIERKPTERAEIIAADLRAEKLEDLFEKLKTVGEIVEKDAASGIAKGDARVRIEIIGNP